MRFSSSESGIFLFLNSNFVSQIALREALQGSRKPPLLLSYLFGSQEKLFDFFDFPKYLFVL